MTNPRFLRVFSTLHVPDTILAGLFDLGLSAAPVRAPPGGPGALDDRPLDYAVVDGRRVARELPAAPAFFRSARVLARLSEAAGFELRPCSHAPAFINVNVLDRIGQDYQLHIDGNAVTLILFLSTLAPEDGGALDVMARDVRVSLSPVRGAAVLFASRQMPHRVAPLLREVRRVSVPVAYEIAGQPDARQAEDDAYLYAAEPAEADA